LTAGLLNIGAIDEGTSRTVAVEVTAYGQDAHGVRLDVFEDSELDVTSLTPPTTIPAGQTIKFFVRIRVPELADNATLEDHRIIVRAANDASSSNIESMDLVAHPVEFQGVPLFGPAATIAALAVAGSATAFFRRRQ
jgi:hypothetical protein